VRRQDIFARKFERILKSANKGTLFFLKEVSSKLQFFLFVFHRSTLYNLKENTNFFSCTPFKFVAEFLSLCSRIFFTSCLIVDGPGAGKSLKEFANIAD